MEKLKHELTREKQNLDKRVKKLAQKVNESYQFSLLCSQIGYIAELFNCGAGKRSNKFTQSTLKQSNSIVYFIAQNVLFYIQPKPLDSQVNMEVGI